MIQILFRHRVAEGTEAAFVACWEQLKKRLLSRPNGPVEAKVFRSVSDPCELVTVTRWESLEDWSNYWRGGVPEPEGERERNEVLVELKALKRHPKNTSRRPRRTTGARAKKR